jgi:hypothetical protein
MKDERMINLTSAMIDRHFRTLMFGGAVLGAVAFLVNLRDVVALIVGHFGVGLQTAFLIIALITDGSVWLMWVFPYMIPFTITIEGLVGIFGVAWVAGW